MSSRLFFYWFPPVFYKIKILKDTAFVFFQPSQKGIHVRFFSWAIRGVDRLEREAGRIRSEEIVGPRCRGRGRHFRHRQTIPRSLRYGSFATHEMDFSRERIQVSFLFRNSFLHPPDFNAHDKSFSPRRQSIEEHSTESKLNRILK